MLSREKRTGNLKFPHVDISPTLNKPRNLISGFVLVTLDFSLTRKRCNFEQKIVRFVNKWHC